ncbi:hypothetical protein ScPMuIL_014352 [Solemya velum]
MEVTEADMVASEEVSEESEDSGAMVVVTEAMAADTVADTVADMAAVMVVMEDSEDSEVSEVSEDSAEEVMEVMEDTDMANIKVWGCVEDVVKLPVLNDRANFHVCCPLYSCLSTGQ